MIKPVDSIDSITPYNEGAPVRRALWPCEQPEQWPCAQARSIMALFNLIARELLWRPLIAPPNGKPVFWMALLVNFEMRPVRPAAHFLLLSLFSGFLSSEIQMYDNICHIIRTELPRLLDQTKTFRSGLNLVASLPVSST